MTVSSIQGRPLTVTLPQALGDAFLQAGDPEAHRFLQNSDLGVGEAAALRGRRAARAWYRWRSRHPMRLLSSCDAASGLGGEGGVFVVVLAGGQAVVQAAEEPAEEVALGSGVPFSVGFAPVVVGSGAG